MNEDMITDHAEYARELFFKGYNCAQSVFCAFCDVTGLDLDTAAKLSSSFGGGMGRLREVCGTVSGALMVLGIARGYSDVTRPELKKDHYHLVQEFAAAFKEKNGSIVCKELLRGVEVKPGSEPEARTPEYYKKRPCPNYVYEAARIVEEML